MTIDRRLNVEIVTVKKIAFSGVGLIGTLSDMSTFVTEDHMLVLHSCQMCYRLEIKLILSLTLLSIEFILR